MHVIIILLRFCNQCVPGSLSAHKEPGDEANIYGGFRCLVNIDRVSPRNFCLGGKLSATPQTLHNAMINFSP